jgi:prolyl oligopeptidase
MKALFISVCCCINYFGYSQLFNYPASPIIPVRETIQDTVFTDNYKWLEQTGSDRTKNWVKEQNIFTNRFIRERTNYLNIEDDVDEISSVYYNFGNRQGKYFFKFFYTINSPTPAVYFQEKLTDPPILLINPRDISAKERVDIRQIKLSADNRYLAYQYSRSGSDWHEIRIADMHSRKDLHEVLTNVKYSGIEWAGAGFFYSRYPSLANQFAPSTGEQIWYHRIGTLQQDDQLIYSNKNNSIEQLSVDVTPDGRYLLLYIKDEDKGTRNIYYDDMADSIQPIKLLLSGEAADISVIGTHNNNFVALSSFKNNNREIIEFSPDKPTELEDGIIVEASLYADGIITVVQSDLSEFVFIYNWDGEVKKVLTFAPGYTVSGFINAADKKKVNFYYSSFTLPPVVFELNLENFEYRKTSDVTVVNYDFYNFEYKKEEYISKDGTKVPLLLMYKKGLKRNGNHPAVLESYGGFGSITRAAFDPSIVYFLNEGGVYAYAYVRGEGAKGSKWAESGKGIHKQNSFDDFISAAEYLISSKYTNPSRLGITGASNGGLVVGAAITQRPDLFRAAVPDVGVFDMLHFENETVGLFHKDEYGTVTDPASFRRLLSYSPLHNISPAKKYPSLFIITSENDDRVPPYHSYKFAATLQSLPQTNPVLLRVVYRAGHYGDPTWEGEIKIRAEVIAFLLHELK